MFTVSPAHVEGEREENGVPRLTEAFAPREVFVQLVRYVQTIIVQPLLGLVEGDGVTDFEIVGAEGVEIVAPPHCFVALRIEVNPKPQFLVPFQQRKQIRWSVLVHKVYYVT